MPKHQTMRSARLAINKANTIPKNTKLRQRITIIHTLKAITNDHQLLTAQ